MSKIVRYKQNNLDIQNNDTLNYQTDNLLLLPTKGNKAFYMLDGQLNLPKISMFLNTQLYSDIIVSTKVLPSGTILSSDSEYEFYSIEDLDTDPDFANIIQIPVNINKFGSSGVLYFYLSKSRNQNDQIIYYNYSMIPAKIYYMDSISGKPPQLLNTTPHYVYFSQPFFDDEANLSTATHDEDFFDPVYIDTYNEYDEPLRFFVSSTGIVDSSEEK